MQATTHRLLSLALAALLTAGVLGGIDRLAQPEHGVAAIAKAATSSARG
jgi:hypothetical protein